jgi:hypothetical protein
MRIKIEKVKRSEKPRFYGPYKLLS